jgi:hypothetical protein
MPIPRWCRAAPQPDPSSFPAIPAIADCLPRCLFCVGIVAIMLFGGGGTRAEPVGPPAGSVAAFTDEAAQRFGVPASWIRAVMRAESGGLAHARSPKGAMGLMQIMPETWAALRSRYGLGTDPYDAHDNILAGAAYLRELHDRYGSPGFLAAYNAGSARYEDHLATGRPLPTETRAYVAAVAPLIDGEAIDGAMVVSAAAPFWSDAPLFAVRAEGNATKSEAVSTGQPATDNAVTDRTVLAPQGTGLFVPIHAGSERVP